MDEGKIIKVVLVNLSQRDAIGMWPVYVDQKGAEGKTTLVLVMFVQFLTIMRFRGVLYVSSYYYIRDFKLAVLISLRYC